MIVEVIDSLGRMMTAMNTLDELVANGDQMPRFDDGMVNMQELIRTMAEALVNEIMSAQADELCDSSENTRNGYRERKLTTCVGTITMRIPKLRIGSYFPDELIERYSRVDRAVVATVAEMYATGVSTRKVERVARKLGIDKMSPSQVSRIASALDASVEDLQKRTFDGVRFAYLWLDATYIRCRTEGHVASVALVSAIAAADDGYRRVVGFDVVDAESYPSWLAFLRSLKERGVDGVTCVTSDAHAGLRRAIEEVFAGAAWQRCVVHLGRNVCACAKTRRARSLVGRIVASVFREEDPRLVREPCSQAIDEVGAICKSAGELLEEAEADALAYLDFPKEHRRRLRTNNVQERTNREIKRRSRVVQVFPSAASLIRLVGTVLAEQDEDWSTRRYFSSPSIAKTFERREPEPEACDVDEIARKAAAIIEIAKDESVAIGKRAA